MKKYLFWIAILLCNLSFNGKAQKNYQLDAPVPSNVLIQRNGVIVARDYIQLKPGFTTATGPVNLRIDEKMICDLSYQAQVDPETRTLDKNLEVGSIIGVGNVSSTGNATYTIPIIISPGTQGIQPQLAIGYNSQGGTGILGKGWDLSGMSAITRSPKNFTIDGASGGVNFDQNDRFSLDGNRLLALSGTYGNQGTTYETYGTTFSKIETPVYNNSFYFKVTTKDGKIIEYGNTADSRATPSGTSNIIAWKINKMTDSNGNYMTFTYRNEDGESVIDRIDYTGNTSAGLQPFNQVQFYYEKKSEKTQYFIAGYSLNHSLILNNVKIICEGKIVKTYNFIYATNFYKESLLNKINEIGNDGKELNSTIIGWSGLAGTLYNNFNTNNFFDQHTLFNGDFNADGRTDYFVIPYKYDGVYTSSDIWELYITNSDGKSFNRVDYGNLSSLFKGVEIVDRDNDGKDDILLKYKEHVEYECNCRPAGTNALTTTKESVSGATTLSIVPPDDPGEICDICGYDQLAYRTYSLISNDLVKSSSQLDITIANPKTYYYQVLPADFNGDGKGDLLIIDDSKNYYSTFGLPNSSSLNFNSPQKVDVIDFNGDGRKDIFVVKDNSCTIYSYNESSRTFTAIYSSSFPTKDHRIFFADFNSDGKTDLMTWNSNKWNINYSTGSTFTTTDYPNSPITNVIDPDLSTTDYNYITLDFNGDGKTDILESYRGGTTNLIINIFYSYGNGFVKETFTDSGLDWILTGKRNYDKFDDLNGDGRADIFMVRGSGIRDNILTFHPMETPCMVEKISDGFNNKLVFQYSSLSTSSSPYTKGSGATFPLSDFQAPLYVVKSMTSPNGNGGTSETTYTYAGAKIHRQGLGFMGFTSFKSTNASINKTIETISVIDPINYHLSSQTNKVSASSTEISNVLTTFTNQKISNGWFSYPSKIVETDKLTGNVLTTTTDYAGDIIGNVYSITKDYGNGFSEVAKYENYFAAGSWIKNKPQIVTISRKHPDDTNTFITQTAYTYDSTTGNLTSQIDNKNLVAEKQVRTDYSDFTSFGQPQTITISATSEGGNLSSTKRYNYEEKGRFIGTYDNGLYIFKYKYDPIFGNLLEENNATLNLTTTYVYNSKGQLTKKVNPDGTTVNTLLDWNRGSGPTNALYYTSTTSEGNPGTKTWYDALGRVLKEEVIDRVAKYTEKEYKNSGELYRLSSYAGGSLISQITYDYFSDGRIKSQTYNTGKVISYSYTNNTVNTTENGKLYEKTYDNWGNLQSSKEPSPGGTISYKYNSNGKPSTITSPASTISIGYDDLGNQNSLNDPDAGNFTYRYDCLGRITYQKDANGNEYWMKYDNYNRLTSKTGSDNKATTYEYVTSGNGFGQVLKITAPNSSYQSYEYDALGRVLKTVNHIDGSNEITFQNNYNNLGKIYQIIYPGNYTVTNTYDQYGNLEVVSNGSTNIWALNEITATKIRYTLGNGQVTEKTYRSNGFLNSIITSKGSVEAQNNVYVFNPSDGLLTSREDKRTGYMLKESFSYDNLDRLTNWEIRKNDILTKSYSLSYKTDASGNIDVKSGIGTFNYKKARPHAIDSLTLQSNSPISLNIQNVTYTEFRKIKTIEENNYKLSVTYGFDEDRIKTELYQNNNLKYTNYYAGLYEKNVGDKTTEYLYIPAGDGLAAVLIKTNGGSGVLHYIHKDHLGSITCITDENGNIKEQYNFDPWGRRRNPNDWSFNNVPVPTILTRGFTGHEHLDEFALINMNGRVYDPILGMFLSPDNYVPSATNSQDYNRYNYARNNPLMYTDPDGQFIHIIIGAVIGGVINLGIKAYQGKIHSFWDGAAAFGIGAAAGAVGAATGGAAFAAMGGAAGGAGGFLAGAAGGMAGSAFSMPIQSIGNSMYFGDPMMTGKEYLMGIGIGGVLGGTFQGISALRNGRSFWTGTLPTPTPRPVTLPIPAPNSEIQLPNNGRATPLPMPDEDLERGLYVLDDARTSLQLDVKGDGIRYIRDSNFRGNLIEASGYDPGDLAQAHHIFPQKYATEFSRAGVNVNRYGAWWETSSHLQSAGRYNNAWGDFFFRNANPSKLDIYNEAMRLRSLFGY